MMLRHLGTIGVLIITLASGCGDDAGGQSGSGGAAAGMGSGGSGGGAAGTAGNAAGSGGNGGMSASTFASLTAATNAYLAEACLCLQNPAQRPACLAIAENVIAKPSEQPCVDAVFGGSTEATSWAECETAAYENAARCVASVPMCDSMMLDDCSETLGDELDPCVSFPQADRDATNACVTPSPEGLLDDLDDAVEVRCMCSSMTPEQCEASMAPDLDTKTCILDAINVGLNSMNGTVAEDTRDAILCASQQFRRWKLCLEGVNMCNLAELDQCDGLFGLNAEGSCDFPDDPPENVDSSLGACFI